MKKFLTLPLVALLLSACADNNPESEIRDDNVARSFLTVSIVSPRSATRADAEYEDGTNSENAINTIRFYFFYDGGQPAPVWKQSSSNSYASYIDWTPTSADVNDEGNGQLTVEKIVTATLGINMPANNNGYPNLVLAVINPSSDVKAIQGNPTLETLTSHVADYYTGLHSENFVITNSVYSTGGDSPELVKATSIDPNCFQPTAEEALDNELIIFVERVLARLDFSISMEGNEITGADGSTFTIYPLGEKTVNDYENSNTQTIEEQIYVRFLGWNITQTPSKSNLVKNIAASWPQTLFGSIEPWNSSDFHRSFWAINPPATSFDYIYGTWQKPTTGDTGNYASALPLPNGTAVTTYLQENAAPYDNNTNPPTNPTEVIIAAQLVNAQGTPVTLVKWANRFYTQTGVLNAIANVLELYSKSGNTYTKITPDQLEFVTADDIYGEQMPEDVANYYVYVQLTEDAQKLDWYSGDTDAATAYANVSDINTYIIDRTNFLMVWESGQTYYYFEIEHLGGEGSPGYYGVVRNHLYKADLTSVAGLGTPVYDPDQTIIPEKPDADQSVLSVNINILQWRVVADSYQLTWP